MLSTAEVMTVIENEIELQLQNLTEGQLAFGGLQQVDMSGEMQSDCGDCKLNTGQPVLDEPLSLLADVALTPSCGDAATSSCDCEACSFVELRHRQRSLQSMRLQLQFLMTKADDLEDCLVNEEANLDSDAPAAAVRRFLDMCQPYFNYLESVKSIMSQQSPLPFDSHTRLLDFSQQLCDRLEQLVLTCASHSLLCLDETEPNSISHFCIGHSQLGQLRLTTFRYCKLMPYLARADTGLYKRMRWNVEKLRDEREQQQETDREQDVTEAEYYFLCYEDIPNTYAETDTDSQCVGMWSIGQWVQENSHPNTEDIYDWITCEVPQASYHRLLYLGSDEPPSCSATDYLQQLLLSHQTNLDIQMQKEAGPF